MDELLKLRGILVLELKPEWSDNMDKTFGKLLRD